MHESDSLSKIYLLTCLHQISNSHDSICQGRFVSKIQNRENCHHYSSNCQGDVRERSGISFNFKKGKAAPLYVSEATRKIATSLKKRMNELSKQKKNLPSTSSDKYDNDEKYCKVRGIKIFPTGDIYFFNST